VYLPELHDLIHKLRVGKHGEQLVILGQNPDVSDVGVDAGLLMLMLGSYCRKSQCLTQNRRTVEEERIVCGLLPPIPLGLLLGHGHIHVSLCLWGQVRGHFCLGAPQLREQG
jgi:hypothetical protein